MTQTNMAWLQELETYFVSGTFSCEFMQGTEEERYALLDFVQKLFDVAEHADTTMSHILLRNMNTSFE